MGPLRQHLRAATAAAHDRVDSAFGRHDLAQRDGYGAFLLSHAMVLPSLEKALERAGIAELIPDWGSRSRRAALEQDLAALRLSTSISLPTGRLEGAPALLGAAYVLEGSRLGGAVLLRRALAGADPAIGAATSYLRHGQGQGLWASFLDLLEASAPARDAPDGVVEGASVAFAAFEAAARIASGPEIEHVETAK